MSCQCKIIDEFRRIPGASCCKVAEGQPAEKVTVRDGFVCQTLRLYTGSVL